MVIEQLCAIGLELWNDSEKISDAKQLLKFLGHAKNCEQCSKTIEDEFIQYENYLKANPEMYYNFINKFEELEKRIESIKI